ncbi:ras-related and estrogen-regulated growth inhibitor-like [Argonauta hians]
MQKKNMDDIMTPHSHSSKEVNLIVLGSPGVGKSAILVRYLTKRFIGDYHPLLETVSSHSTVVDDKTVLVHIRDTTWKAIDSQQRESHLSWADGIMVVYSIMDRESFECCKNLVDKVLQLCDDATPISVLGNKVDMLHMRQVQYEEGLAFCRNRNLLFSEVSAGDSYDSVEKAVRTLIQEVRHCRKKKEKKNSEGGLKLDIRQSLKNFTEKRLQIRHRTSTL